MPKKGYETVTIKTKTLETLQQIGKQINKTVPETITILANIFIRYDAFFKAIAASSPLTTADLMSLLEQVKIQTEQEVEKVTP
jgi:hypothetical protein